jgi:hypothetical protein
VTGSADKPWLFLDVDGVVIPGGVVWRASAFDDGTRTVPDDCKAVRAVHPHFGEFIALIPDAIIARIQRLAEAFEIVWLSTWGELACELEPVLGISSAGAIKARPRGFSDSTPRKGEALAEWLKGEYRIDWDAVDAGRIQIQPQLRPFAWVDDQLPLFESELDYEFAGDEDEHELPPSLRVRTNEDTALTDEQTAELLAFAASCKEQ